MTHVVNLVRVSLFGELEEGGGASFLFPRGPNILMAALDMILCYWLDLKLHIQSVPITTNSMRSNPAHGEVYSIQHYVIKFVSNLSLVGGFLRWVSSSTPVSSTFKTDCHDSRYDSNIVESGVKHHNSNYNP